MSINAATPLTVMGISVYGTSLPDAVVTSTIAYLLTYIHIYIYGA